MPRDPKKINNYVILDWETGGLSCVKNPVMEFAGLALNAVTLEEIIRYDNFIQPYDNSLVYEQQSMNVTGITKERVGKEGIPLRQLVDDICALFSEANIYNSKTAKPILIAHNADFDKGFLQEVFRRANVDLSKYVAGTIDPWGNFQPRFIDSIDIAKACWAPITDTDTKFKLTNCCEKAGIEQVDAHRAMNDVLPLTDLMRYFLTRLRSEGSQVTVVDGVATSHRKTFEW